LKALSEPILRSPISMAFQILGPASQTVKRLTFVLHGIRCRLNLFLVLWSCSEIFGEKQLSNILVRVPL